MKKRLYFFNTDPDKNLKITMWYQF
jgi:hypothetical protein